MGDNIVARAATAATIAAIIPCGTIVAVTTNATTRAAEARTMSRRCQVRTT
jgi:hypothetical protein